MHCRMLAAALASALLVVPAASLAGRDAGTGDAGARAAYDTHWATIPSSGPGGGKDPAPSKPGDDGSVAPTPAPKAEPAPAPATPSGPKEAAEEKPRFTAEQRKAARDFLEMVWKASEQGPLPCEKVVQANTRAVLVAAELSKADVAAHPMGVVALARCAEAQGYFGLMGDLSKMLLDYGKKDAHPELLARAVLGLGRPDVAMKVLAEAEKVLPKDPDVAVTKAKVLCRVRLWPECHAQAERALALAKSMPDKALREAIVNRALKYRGRSGVHLGKLDAALADADASEAAGGDKDDLEQVRASALEAKEAGAVLDVEVEDLIPLGTYHLVGKVKGAQPLVDVALIRLGTEPARYRVEAEVPGVTGRFTKTVVAMPGREQRVSVHPPLLPTFDPTQVRAAREVQVDVSIVALESGGERGVYKKSATLTLQPRDFLPLARFTDKEETTGNWVSEYIGAWVTPNVRAVDAFLKAAKQRAPKAAFAGEQAETGPQVKALYDELQARGMSYVMDPNMMAADGMKGQRTRLPTEVLASTNAQCLEGAILYATLFEAIGLRSAVVLVPGHAFVGWAAAKPDGVADGIWFFLETTATHDATFMQALKIGGAEFQKYKEKKAATVLPIAELRKLGVSPQPYDN